MENSPQQYEAFLNQLTTMGEFFGDELSVVRLELYWKLLGPLVTLDEWAHACTQAMTRESFHKVPLPAVLLDYVKEYRRAQREALLQQQCAEGVRTRKRLLELRESLVDPAEVDALIASVWPEEQIAPQPLYPRPRVRVTPDDLRYEPSGDPEAAKRKARAQLRQLLEQGETGEDVWPIERKG